MTYTQSAHEASQQLLFRLMELLVPADGKALFLVEAYFDESGTHNGSQIMCVGGYLFSPDQCRKFGEEWTAVLEEFDLPYFRMSECAHATGVFKGKDKICDVVARRMIGIIKRRAERGLVTTVSEQDFKNSIAGQYEEFTGPAYSWCIRWAFGLVRSWIDDRQFKGTISYFFESGHQHQDITNKVLDRWFRRESPLRPDVFRYGSHTFSGKIPTEKNPVALVPLQAADLLAWQYRTHKRRQSEGKNGMRLDLRSLLEIRHDALEWDASAIEETMKIIIGESNARYVELSPGKIVP